MSKKIFSAWIGNLGAYTEGKLVGEWLGMPCSKEDIENLYEKIGVKKGNDEIFIADYDFPSDVSYLEKCCSEYEKPEELNMVAGLIDRYEPDKNAMQACIENEQTVSLNEVGNMIVQAENIPYYAYDFQGIKNIPLASKEEKYGYTVAEATGLYEKLADLNIESYVDFELYISHTYDFIQELLSKGAAVEVLKPQSLRDKIKAEIQNMQTLYRL